MSSSPELRLGQKEKQGREMAIKINNLDRHYCWNGDAWVHVEHYREQGGE